MSLAEYIFYAAANALWGALFGFSIAHLLHKYNIWSCLS